MIWNEQTEAELSKLWGAGKSASKIGAHFGISRGAVLGKLHRLRERGGDNSVAREAKISPAKAQRSTHKNSLGASFGLPKLKAEKIKAAPPAPPESLRVPLFEIPVGGCKFAVTGHDVATHEHLFCGVKAEGVYCPYHQGIAYQPASERRREKAKRNFVQRSSNADRFNAGWR